MGQARLNGKRALPRRLRISESRARTRPAARLSLPPNARHLLDLRVKPLVTERLALIESEPNIVDGRTIKVRVEQRTIGGLPFFVVSPQRSI